eukprot:868030-Prorocentrum_minimum.AAC.4
MTQNREDTSDIQHRTHLVREHIVQGAGGLLNFFWKSFLYATTRSNSTRGIDIPVPRVEFERVVKFKKDFQKKFSNPPAPHRAERVPEHDHGRARGRSSARRNSKGLLSLHISERYVDRTLMSSSAPTPPPPTAEHSVGV